MFDMCVLFDFVFLCLFSVSFNSVVSVFVLFDVLFDNLC